MITKPRGPKGLADWLAKLKAGERYGYRPGNPKVHPALHPEERDLIVKALMIYAKWGADFDESSLTSSRE